MKRNNRENSSISISLPENYHINEIMAIKEKLEAAASWCCAKYGDASIIYDMLYEIDEQLETVIYDMASKCEEVEKP